MNVIAQQLKSRRGFTLLEVLIVVAIIAILTAISIPVLGDVLERARETTDIANLRTAYMEAITEFAQTGTSVSKNVKATQRAKGWIIRGEENTNDISIGNEGSTFVVPESTVGWILTVADDGTVSISVMTMPEEPEE